MRNVFYWRLGLACNILGLTMKTGFTTVACIVASFLFLGSCAKAPYSIGFIGPMTGPSANIGVEGYRGFTMGIEEVNAGGGINGRQIVVNMLDDRSGPEACLAASMELVGRGVDVIVLHTTSSAAAGALPWLLEQDVLVISRTVSDTAWAGLDDNFLRIVGNSDMLAWPLGEFVQEKGYSSIGLVVDQRNESYARSIIAGFMAKAGQIQASDPYYIDSGWSHDAVARWVMDSEFDCVFAVLSGLDAAQLAQALERTGYKNELLLPAWSQDHNLLSYAGRMADRIFIASAFNPDDASPAYQAFKGSYRMLYGEAPVMSGVFGYEVAGVLLAGLSRTRRSDAGSLKAALLEIGNFQGLQYEFTLDPSGDATIKIMVVTIRGGAYVSVER